MSPESAHLATFWYLGTRYTHTHVVSFYPPYNTAGVCVYQSVCVHINTYICILAQAFDFPRSRAVTHQGRVYWRSFSKHGCMLLVLVSKLSVVHALLNLIIFFSNVHVDHGVRRASSCQHSVCWRGGDFYAHTNPVPLLRHVFIPLLFATEWPFSFLFFFCFSLASFPLGKPEHHKRAVFPHQTKRA